MRIELMPQQATQPVSTEGRADAIAKEVYRMALVLTANPNDAEKVSRQALARAWKNVVELRAGTPAEPLLCEIVRGALEVLRLRRGDLRGWLEEPLTDMDAAVSTIRSSDIQQLFRTSTEGPRFVCVLDEFVLLDCMIFVFREAEQISLDEAARLTGMSRREAGLRLNRARVELHGLLAKRPAFRAPTFTMHFPGSVQNT